MTPRILLFSFYFRPDLSPGSFRATALAEALVEAGAEVQVVTSSPNRYASHKVEAEALEVSDRLSIHRMPVTSHSGGMLSQARMYRHFAWPAIRLGMTSQADAVVVTTGRMFTATLAAFVARRLKKPLYIDMRDIFVDTIEDVLPKRTFRLMRPMLRLLERYTFRRATQLNLVSPGFTPYARQHFPNTPIEVHTNGIDALFLENQQAAAPLRPAGRRWRIVYAGNVGEGQGLHHILPDAARELAGEAEFVIYGDGGRIQALVDACAAARVDNVTIHAPVARHELAAIYASADALFVHLNDYRAFLKVLPSKLFEYGATGRPILAGVSGAAADFVRSELPDAALFAPRNVAALVASIRRLGTTDSLPDRSEFLHKYDRKTISRAMARSILELPGVSSKAAAR